MISKSVPTHSGTTQVQSIIITAITVFAFSGLIVGFAVGAFVRPAKPATANNSTNPANSVTNHTTPTPTPTPTSTTIPAIPLGPPDLIVQNPTPNTEGSASIQVKDKQGKPITADGITCRVWLVPAQTNVPDDLNNDTDQLKHVDTLNQAFPHEIPNALTFDPATTNQQQTCQQGTAQWKFTLSPTVTKGDYYLVGLTDWQGQHWNYSWKGITVSDKTQ